jgi:hypothetical protein
LHSTAQLLAHFSPVFGPKNTLSKTRFRYVFALKGIPKSWHEP